MTYRGPLEFAPNLPLNARLFLQVGAQDVVERSILLDLLRHQQFLGPGALAYSLPPCSANALVLQPHGLRMLELPAMNALQPYLARSQNNRLFLHAQVFQGLDQEHQRTVCHQVGLVLTAPLTILLSAKLLPQYLQGLLHEPETKLVLFRQEPVIQPLHDLFLLQGLQVL